MQVWTGRSEHHHRRSDRVGKPGIRERRQTASVLGLEHTAQPLHGVVRPYSVAVPTFLHVERARRRIVAGQPYHGFVVLQLGLHVQNRLQPERLQQLHHAERLVAGIHLQVRQPGPGRVLVPIALQEPCRFIAQHAARLRSISRIEE